MAPAPAPPPPLNTAASNASAVPNGGAATSTTAASATSFSVQLSKEFEKVIKRQKTCADQTNERIDKLIADVEVMKASLIMTTQANLHQQGDPAAAPVQSQQQPHASPAAESAAIMAAAAHLASITKEAHTHIAESHRELYSALSKYTKQVDKRFNLIRPTPLPAATSATTPAAAAHTPASVNAGSAMTGTPITPAGAGSATSVQPPVIPGSATNANPLDLDSIWDPRALEGPEKGEALNRAVALHFMREGRFDLADMFAGESGLPQGLTGETRVRFREMYQILEGLRSGKMTKAIEWCELRSKQLQALGSALEFQLLRLRFIQILLGGSVPSHGVGEGMDFKTEADGMDRMVEEPILDGRVSRNDNRGAKVEGGVKNAGRENADRALAYARTAFGKFFGSQKKEIQRLMTAVLYPSYSRLARSPYADLLDPNLLPDIQTTFTRDFCRLMGLPSDSPLLTSVTIGVNALPTIVKMSSVLRDKGELGKSQRTELPIEIPLLDSQRFHSVFTCPVSKEQATEDNPPMMMVCGHVICKESLGRMSKGSAAARIKCPYCPSESAAAQSVRVYF
ncbi:hypothetical protein HK101_004805 [Irineochytrium annulatum]|nr:hypothetical protein HK101_004805 [Irineochytrium annulatum]